MSPTAERVGDDDVALGAERRQVAGFLAAEPFIGPVMDLKLRVFGARIAHPTAEAGGLELL